VISDSAAKIAAALADTAAADSVAAAVAKAAGAPIPGARSTSKKPPAPVSRPCVLDFADSPPETRFMYSRVSDVSANTFIGGGFIGHCQGENNRIQADSAEQFQDAGIINLYGNVSFEEPGKMRLTAARATYFTREGRLYADGNVVATQLATGSTFTGPNMEYYREVPGVSAARMLAPGRPTARLIEKDSTGKPGAPVIVIANTFEDRGDTLLLAWGNVVITRDAIEGRSDSSSFDKITERARLVRGARINNTDPNQTFVLTGDTIDLFSTNRQLERVVALHEATATSQDLVMQAERIDLRLTLQKISQAFAFGRGRATAQTPQQNVEADSLHILLPEQKVRQVRAVGRAIALGVPDTTRMVSEDRDMLRGDSVFAFFDSTAAPDDTAKTVQIREIRALGNASSLFQMASNKGRTVPPSINYTRGARIFVDFDSGAVRTVRVDSAASGVFLEPVTDSLVDSTGSSRRPVPPPVRRPPDGPEPVPSPAQPVAFASPWPSPAKRRAP